MDCGESGVRGVGVGGGEAGGRGAGVGGGEAGGRDAGMAVITATVGGDR